MKNVTFVMLKPDALAKKAVYPIMEYFYAAGITVACFDVVTATKELVSRHYAEHFAKYGSEFADRMLCEFEGKTVVPAVLAGEGDVIARVREIVGATQPGLAAKGTIRGDLGGNDTYEITTWEKRVVRNLIHASDSPEAVKREAGIWLPRYRIPE